MDRCQNCDSYNSGRGTRKCLRCDLYRSWSKLNGIKNKISIQIVPDALLENIACGQPTEALEAMRRLPTYLSAVICMRYYGRMEIQEIATLLGLSRSAIEKRIARALQVMREVL